MAKSKHTPGKWTFLKIKESKKTIIQIEGDNFKGIIPIAEIGPYNCQKLQDANANLIADAGTTTNKCNLLPSELLEQRDELLQALNRSQELLQSIYTHHVSDHYKTVVSVNEAAIKKATE